MGVFGGGSRAGSSPRAESSQHADAPADPLSHMPGAGEVLRLGERCRVEGADPDEPGDRFPHGVAGMPRLVRAHKAMPQRTAGEEDLVAPGDVRPSDVRYLFSSPRDQREARGTAEVADDVLAEATGKVRRQIREMDRLRSLGRVRRLAFTPTGDGTADDFTCARLVRSPGRGALLQMDFVSQDGKGARGSVRGTVCLDGDGYVESVDVETRSMTGAYRVLATRLPQDGLAVRRVERVEGQGFRGVLYEDRAVPAASGR